MKDATDFFRPTLLSACAVMVGGSLSGAGGDAAMGLNAGAPPPPALVGVLSASEEVTRAEVSRDEPVSSEEVRT